MTDTNVFQLTQRGTFADPLTEVLRNGARALLAQAVEAEVTALLSLAGTRDHDRHRPGRGSPAACARPRSYRGARIRYSPSILPRYARLSQSLEVLIPILYLKGISTGDFEEVLAALAAKS